MDEHILFIQTLTDEYHSYKEKYKGKIIEDTDVLRKYLIMYVDRLSEKFDITYEGFLDHSYNYYCNILQILKNIHNKNEMRRVIGKSHLWIGHYFLQDFFVRMYWVIQDAVYFYISKLNPQMHEINLMFIDFFKKRKKESDFDQPHKELYDYHATPSCPQFKYLLLGYDEKYLDEIEFSPIFTMFLYPITLTNYGKDNILEVLNYFGIKLQKYAEKNGISLLRYHFQRYIVRNLNRMKKLKNDIKLMSKEAENDLRVNKNLPKVGESWIEETKLYYLIKEDFPNLLVIQHGKPAFLRKQHYDIWIPELKIAIEYQGEQHSIPIDYFGGYEAYISTKERDERKRLISIENNVTLLYVKKNYLYPDLREKIKTSQNGTK
jgi:hypothetical protein